MCGRIINMMKLRKLLFLIVVLPLLSKIVYSFPYNETYPYGFSSAAKNQQAANEFLIQEWEDWKRNFVTQDGASGYKRVQRDASTNYDTVSEGLGYGLLFSVYFDDRQLFDALYNYVKLYLNNNGLMCWHIDASGNVTAHDGGYGAATDADEDIALALIFAHKMWGSDGQVNYEQEAKYFVNNLYNYCVENSTYVLKPGDSWGGSNVTNPSYFSPSWYKIFADFTGNNDWLRVADKCYEIVENVKNYNSNTGLVPDWCQANGNQASGQGYDYSYDATRYPWRTAIDYSWFGDERAKVNVDLITRFFSNIGANNIVDGYTITGSIVGSYHNASFVSMVAAGSMTGYDLRFAQELYEENKSVKDSGSYSYYGNCLRLLSLLYITGNFPNLYNYGSSTPEVIFGDLNGDKNINSIDYILLRRYVLKVITDFPSENGHLSADINEDYNINTQDYVLLGRMIIEKN